MSKEKPGPPSESGKRSASQNAAKHLMTGRVLLLPGEKPCDLAALVAQWQEEYPTDTVEAAKLVQEAAHNEWLLLRVQRQSDKTLVDLFQTGMDAWQEAEHKRYQLTQRYLTAAERKLERNRRAIWQYRREVRAEAREKRAELLFAARYGAAGKTETAETAQPAAEEPEEREKMRDSPLTQTAYVSKKDGQTVTRFQPPNANILNANGRWLESALVKRQIRFECAELPAEYAWCLPDLADVEAPLEKKAVLLFHTLRTFHRAVEREAASGGHVQQCLDLYAEDKDLIDPQVEKEWLRYNKKTGHL
jgi:hypothetical protein